MFFIIEFYCLFNKRYYARKNITPAAPDRLGRLCHPKFPRYTRRPVSFNERFYFGELMNLIEDGPLEMPDRDTPIWRYMDLAQFLDLIAHRRLFFANGDKLTDKHEGAVPDAIIASKRKDLELKGLSGRDLEEEMAVFQMYEANAMLGLALFNCWSAEEEESYALWKIYLGGQRLGFAVKSTVGRLIDAIDKGKDKYSEDYFIGRVQYSEKLPKNSKHRLILLTRKMPFYKYENEIRLIILNYPRSEGGTKTPYPLGVGRYVKADTHELVEKAYLSPFAPGWFKKQ